MQQLKAVLIISGDPCNLNQAWPEMVEIARGYGLDVDVVRDDVLREGACRK